MSFSFLVASVFFIWSFDLSLLQPLFDFLSILVSGAGLYLTFSENNNSSNNYPLMGESNLQPPSHMWPVTAMNATDKKS